MKIYTKTGDKGESSLYNGARLPKDAQHFCAVGDVDELNSAIGIAREFGDNGLAEQMAWIQSRLLDVGSAIATPVDDTSSSAKKALTAFDAEHTGTLESWIDDMDTELPRLTQFILPSGGKQGAHLHLARTVCRRAERAVMPLVREETCDASVAVFLNRLSDYLFTAARYASMRCGEEEVTYKKQKN